MDHITHNWLNTPLGKVLSLPGGLPGSSPLRPSKHSSLHLSHLKTASQAPPLMSFKYQTSQMAKWPMKPKTKLKVRKERWWLVKGSGGFHHCKTLGSFLLSSRNLFYRLKPWKFFFSSSRILKIALHLTFKIVFDPTLFQLCSLLQTHSIP